ncbi:MAG: ABC transporter permease subunit [Anaerohalosphaera sp.]|nr:ABC transporter permease subunit [Anaerohalosphaera sp.]
MDVAGTLTSRSILPVWLTGPILDKELRVASRRKRYYFTRSLYLAVMAILVLSVWLSQNATLGLQSSVYNVSRMAEVGRTVIVSVVWFQFIAIQIAAILFFSSAICEEMNKGTLNVLMTTPITTLQIVMGKLLSKLLQLVLLISLSLMTLSIVYIFGGVHWDYILSTFFITLTAVIFTGSLSLFCSGRFKRTHTVIIIMLTFISVYYMIGPMLISILSNTSTGSAWLLMANPMAVMLEMTKPTITSVVAGSSGFSWPIHCLLMLGISVLLVIATTIGLRRSILNFAFETRAKKNGLLGRFRKLFLGTGYKFPIVLKNVPVKKWYRCKSEVILLCFLLSGYMLGYYALYLRLTGSAIRSTGIGIVFFSTWSMTVWLIVVARTVVCASTAVTKEKESRSLSVLLCCPLTDSQIISGKAKHIFRSNQVGWIVLIINSGAIILVSILFSYNQSGSLPSIFYLYSLFSVLQAIGNLIFIIGFGLYLSTKLKSSTAAMITGLVGFMSLYFVIYLVTRISPAFLGRYISFYMLSIYIRPFVYIGAGLLFYWRAKRLLRTNSGN